MVKPQLRCQCPIPLQNKEKQQEKCQVVHVNEAATVATCLLKLRCYSLWPGKSDPCCRSAPSAQALLGHQLWPQPTELQMKTRIETRARRKYKSGLQISWDVPGLVTFISRPCSVMRRTESLMTQGPDSDGSEGLYLDDWPQARKLLALWASVSSASKWGYNSYLTGD